MTYTPAADYNGPDSFTYTITDDGTTNGVADPKTSTATVSLTVTEVNDSADRGQRHGHAWPRTARSASTRGPTTARGPANEAGQTLAVTAVTQGAHGTVSFTATRRDLHAGRRTTTAPTASPTPSPTTARPTASPIPRPARPPSASTVTEVNDAPTVMSGPAQTANENDLVTITSTFADVDPNQTHTCSINWGDGSASTAGTVTETGDHTSGSCSGTHRYLDDAPTGTPSDTYVASVTVTDNGTTTAARAKSGFANTNVTINNVKPVIVSATGPTSPTDKASPITVSAQFTDVGTLDTHVCNFTWDDGTTTTTACRSAPSVTSCSAIAHLHSGWRLRRQRDRDG